jgi:NADPH:quinone reductase-like Zn-dependent oxidoreductase
MSSQLKGSGVAGHGQLMRAAGMETLGGEVQILELAAPQSLAPDEVVIAVRAAGVGNWDEILRGGGWDVGRRPPLVLGVEAAGVVVAVGEEVTSLAPGDEVLTHPFAPASPGHLGGAAGRTRRTRRA